MSKGKQRHLRKFLLMGIYTLGILGILASTDGGSGSDDPEEPPPPPPPKIAGIWSGTWSGSDPNLGPIAGTWQARLSQNDTVVQGPISFSGDLDCAEGDLDAIADGATNTVSGVVTRDPCPAADWNFNDFNDVDFIASGEWDKGVNTGFFEGKRIATFTGPYIQYVYPPAAKAFDYITIVGERLNIDPVNDSLTLGEGGIALVPISVSDTVITLQLPGTVIDSDHIVLTTADGERALSPKTLSIEVHSPNTGAIKNVALGAAGTMPGGIAVSANGRRAFVANRASGSVSMINIERELEQVATVVLPGAVPPVPIHAVAMGPAGRKVYAAGDGVVAVLHGQTDQLMRTLAIPAFGSGVPNPQGIAVSPDGRWLLVSEAIDGGRVSVIDVDNNYTVADTLTMAAGNTPRGIATSPDNSRAYIAVSGTDNEIWAYDFASATVDATIAIGTSPAAVAVTPDANWLYVINTPATTVDYYELGTAASGVVDLGPGVVPSALAITPDGQNLFVASSINSVQVINTVTRGVTQVDVGGPSAGIAVSPIGKRAFATVPSLDRVVEISNQVVVRVSKEGGGMGTITSSPAGINCGATCIASFDAGTNVVLTASNDVSSNSSFSEWRGVPGCSGNPVCQVTLLGPMVFLAVIDAVSNDCFIATAAYGSWLDPRVETLRKFRDEHLMTNAPGRWFVGFYYRHSPPIADYFREREYLKAVVRVILGMIVFAIEYPITAGLLVVLPPLLIIRRRRRRMRFACHAGEGV